MSDVEQLEGQAPDENVLSTARKDQSFVGEIWDFMRVRKKYWLAPIIIALVLLGALIIFAGQAGVVSPFVYML